MTAFSKIIDYSIPIAILFALASCNIPSGNYKPKNVATIYNPSLSPLHPEFVIYHNSDSISQIYFRINTSELLFNDANPEKQNRARFSVRYKLYQSFASGIILDSARLEFIVPETQSKGYYTSNFPLPVLAGKKLSLELEVYDELNHNRQMSYLSIDKRDSLSAQNFLVRDSNNMVIFRTYLFEDEQITIENNRLQADSLLLVKYPLIDESPLPPFSMAKSRFILPAPDSSVAIDFSKPIHLSLSKVGIYFITADPMQKKGKTIFRFHEYFPETKIAEDLIDPLLYLSTKKEFKNILRAGDSKLAVDSFWLDASGNMYRARELIRVFYSRVFFANYYFTADKEGWLTDRGMIYIIFGPPKTIYKSDVAERWIYGSDRNLSSMDFYFELHENPFSDRTYILKRQEIFKASWYQAIDTWRNGRAYSILN